jgi:hypothetical protein
MGYLALTILKGSEYSADFHVFENDGVTHKDLTGSSAVFQLYLLGETVIHSSHVCSIVPTTIPSGTVDIVRCTIPLNTVNTFPSENKGKDDRYLPEDIFYAKLIVTMLNEPDIITYINKVRVI